jgi:N-glycosylase/DNA lyase
MIRRSPEGIEFTCAPDSEATLAPLVRDYLRLDDDLDSIYRAITLDERIGAAIARYRGMRIIRQEPWECLISFICSSNSNIRRISGNVEDMSSAFGRPLMLDNQMRSTFPTPQALAEAGEQKLRQLGLGFRAKYVASAARTVADGKLDLMALREAPYEEALSALLELPGVGDKVANCVLLFSLDKLEAFPVDVWIDRAMREWYLGDGVGAHSRAPLRRNAMRPWAQAYFGPYAGYANQYLFQRRRLMNKNET